MLSRGAPAHECAGAWSLWLCQVLLALLCACGWLCPGEAQDDATCLLSASQNDYRIDPNQELLAMGKRPLRAGEQGLGVSLKCSHVSHSP